MVKVTLYDTGFLVEILPRKPQVEREDGLVARIFIRHIIPERLRVIPSPNSLQFLAKKIDNSRSN